MTQIHQAGQEGLEREKWRIQAAKAAAHMKRMELGAQEGTYLAGFVFDDGVVNLPVPIEFITRINEKALADWVFDSVLQAIADHRAAGESADAQAPGMECGHAAPPNPAPAAAAVVPEQCKRKVAPEFTERCPNQTTQGIRLNLFPADAIIKRYGKRSMLSLVLDLPICPDCFTKMSPEEVIGGLDPKLWTAIGKEAQRVNSGILVKRENCEIEAVGFDHPEYVVLRKQVAGRAAKDSQPGQAAPQQGAGDAQRCSE